MDLFAETRKYLTGDGRGNWSFKSGHVLYLSSEQGRFYSRGKEGDEYNAFHDATVRLINRFASEIIGQLPEKLTIIDLGPEYPDKTLPLLRARKLRAAPADYVAVDVNGDFLSIATQAASPYARSSRGISALFQKCADAIPADIYPDRLAFIGLTFMNAAHYEVMPMMRGIAGSRGYIGVATELVTKDNPVSKILAGYNTPDHEDFTFAPLKNLGIERSSVVYDIGFRNGRVELGYLFDKAVNHLGIQAGDRIMVVPSYRYTADQFAGILQNYGRASVWREPKGKTAVALIGPNGY